MRIQEKGEVETKAEKVSDADNKTNKQATKQKKNLAQNATKEKKEESS